MNFSVTAPLDQTSLAVAAQFHEKLPGLSAGQSLTHLYLHWEVVNGYNVCDSAYNGVIHLPTNGAEWEAVIMTDPRLNAVQVSDGAPYAAHTYLRNSHAFGLAVSGMWQADPDNFGPNPLTLHEVETLCASAAVVAIKYNIDAADKSLVMTHGEAAILDGYFPPDNPPCRWDLARLSPSDAPLTHAEAIATGTLLRTRIHGYKLHLLATLA